MNKMNKKSYYLFYTFIFLTSTFLVTTFYLSYTKSMSDKMLSKKMIFLKTSQLPDLALFNGQDYIRNRSLTSVFCIYKDDGSLREYSVFTYAISNSHIGQK